MRLLPIAILALLLGACGTAPDTRPMAGERYALIQTGTTRLAHGIFPVAIYNIDGKEIHSDRLLHKVKPGVHTIAARAAVDRRLLSGVSKDPTARGSEPLTYNFQSGRRYFLGLKAEGSRSRDWRLVVWKIEDVEAGTVRLED